MSTTNIEEATQPCPLKKKESENELQRIISEFNHLATIDNFNRVANKVRPVSVSADKLICELVVEAEHVNTKGTLHGGFSAALVDIVTARAVGVTVRDKGMASVEIAASYLLPVKLGERIQINATVLKIGRSLAFTDIEFIREDGRVAVKGKHTIAILPNEPQVEANGRIVQY